MTTTTLHNFSQNIDAYFNQAVAHDTPVAIASDGGSAVLISEEEYNNMIATLELMRVPGLVDRILAAAKEPVSTYKKYDPNEAW